PARGCECSSPPAPMPPGTFSAAARFEGWRGQAASGGAPAFPGPLPVSAARPLTRHRETEMKISQIMTRDVEIASPDDTLEAVAPRMAASDIGLLPVGEDGQLVGMVTDRDIAVRGVARGLDGSARVRDVMSGDVKYCFQD